MLFLLDEQQPVRLRSTMMITFHIRAEAQLHAGQRRLSFSYFPATGARGAELARKAAARGAGAMIRLRRKR